MITLISALLPSLDRDRHDEQWKDLYQLLLDTKIPLVLYMEPELMAILGTNFDPSRLVIRPMNIDTLTSGLWLYDDFFALGKSLHIKTEELMVILIRLRSLGWLNDESIFNQFGSERFIWIDPTLLDEINPSYLHSQRGLSLMGPLLEQMLILQQPNLDINESVSTKLFGGNASVLSAINNAYWNTYALSIKQGRMPTFSSLIATLCQSMPEYFTRYILQSNGLEGALFEDIGKGVVPVETTYLQTYE